MKFSESMRKGARLSTQMRGRFISHSSRGTTPRACAVGAAMIGKLGVNAHCVSITDVKREFPEVPAELLMEVFLRNDRTYKGVQMSVEQIADFVENNGY